MYKLELLRLEGGGTGRTTDSRFRLGGEGDRHPLAKGTIRAMGAV